jgi:hypothetical protein
LNDGVTDILRLFDVMVVRQGIGTLIASEAEQSTIPPTRPDPAKVQSSDDGLLLFTRDDDLS